MSKGKRTDGGGILQKFLICLAISILVILLLSMLSAIILGTLDDPTSLVGLFSLGCMLISAALSGVVCSRLKGDGGLSFATLVALAMVLVMLLINVILCGGRVSGGAFMNYGCYMGVSALSAFLARKRVSHKRHKY